MEKSEMTPGAAIERGKIIEKSGGKYRVESYTRSGVTTRWIEAINQYVNEYRSDPPYEEAAYENKYSYSIGDEVYFFLLPDGRGMILGKMTRE